MSYDEVPIPRAVNGIALFFLTYLFFEIYVFFSLYLPKHSGGIHVCHIYSTRTACNIYSNPYLFYLFVVYIFARKRAEYAF